MIELLTLPQQSFKILSFSKKSMNIIYPFPSRKFGSEQLVHLVGDSTHVRHTESHCWQALVTVSP